MTDAPAPPRAARLPIEPRIRERLVAVQRAQGRRRLKIIIGIMAVVGLAGLAFLITRLPVLAVRHVDVTGEVHTPRAAVLGVTGLDKHPQMLDLSAGRLRRDLMALPWVASSHIHRHWPTTVEIHLTERVPVAEVAGPGGQPALVDREGRILATGAAAGAGGLPAMQGVGLAGRPGTFLAGSSGVRDALALAAALPPALPSSSPNRLQAVVIGKDGTLQARLAPGVTVLFGSADGLDAKLLALRTLLERVDLKGVATLDVRVPDAPALTHRGQGSTVSTIPRG